MHISKKQILHSLKISLIFAMLINMLANSSFADGPAISPTGGTDYNQGSYSLGWNFVANGNLKVSALGFYDGGNSGLTKSHAVGIYDNNCNLIASTTVSPTDPLIGRFRYHGIGFKVTLVSGQKYYIAAVTGGEVYLIDASSVGASSDITYGGFSIFGNTLSTTELKCPNGTQQANYPGDYGPNFYIGDLPSEVPNTPPSDPNKRNSAITLFCNRTGPTLSTAVCTATLSDAGPPTRTLPTGAISWEASEGFVPATASCNPTQVALSPGVGACNVEFSVPAGFTIGAKFPISVLYNGDATFNGSAAGHKLIIPKCVSTDPANPCPNSIGLTFPSGSPAIIKAKIKAFIQCGSNSNAEAASARSIPDILADLGSGGVCAINGISSINLTKLLKTLSFDDAKALGASITSQEANTDTLYYLIKNASEKSDAERWKILQETQSAIDALVKDVLINRVQVRNDADAFNNYIRATSPATSEAKSKPKFDKSYKSETVSIEVKPDKQKGLTFKLPKRTKGLVDVFKRAGISTIPLDISIKAKQKKRKGTATITESVDFVIE